MTRKPILIELFAGTCVMSKAFREIGFRTLTIDNDGQHDVDMCVDISTLTIDDLPEWARHPDVIHSSPPCQAFSVAAMGHYWGRDESGNRMPKHQKTIDAMNLHRHALALMRELNPKIYWIENPRGMLRKMDWMLDMPRYTVTYCQYGDTRMKPTDWWTNSILWCPKPMCHPSDSCHERASRGSCGGTQRLHGSVRRSMIPMELCDDIASTSNLECRLIDEGYDESDLICYKMLRGIR